MWEGPPPPPRGPTLKGAFVWAARAHRAAVTDSRRQATLQRTCVYFHHIIATGKRTAIRDWAAELRLGGFAKIGWPGVVVVEGAQADVQEFLTRLQMCRWKQMTIRGEEVVQGGPGAGIDQLRRLPPAFAELGPEAMHELATACRKAGLEELFLTSMKIYR